MAIKFSQFVVQTNASALSHIVGYNGADNIQITPADFINSLVPGGPFLPLAGGTMTGDVIFGDGIVAKFGDGQDLRIQSIGNQGYIQNYTGDLQIQNRAVDKDILFRADDGAGGQTTYLTVDGANEVVSFQKDSKHEDNIRANFGNASDLQIYHDGINSYVTDAGTGDLRISANNLRMQNADNSANYIKANNTSNVELYFNNSKKIETTNTGVEVTGNIDLADGATRSIIGPTNSNLIIEAKPNQATEGLFLQINATDKLSILQDGNATFAGDVNVQDNLYLQDGSVTRAKIQLNSSDRDNLDIKAVSLGSTMSFYTVDTLALTLDASQNASFTGDVSLLDAKVLKLGTSADLQLFHESDNSFISNNIGDLTIRNLADDKDIIFQSDDGSGGLATYFYLDGSGVLTRASRNFRASDSIKLQAGSSGDLSMYHDGTDSYLQNDTGDLYIRNQSDDKDIIFQSDNGSGGVATYFFLDGGNTFTNFQLNARWVDNAKAQFGNSGDMELYHDGNHSYVKSGGTGDLYIQQFRDDGDIVFQSDDGSGGMTEYFKVDGGITKTVFARDTKHLDNKKALFGDQDDLQIYHDGSNSIIKDSGAGNLVINAGSLVVSNAADTQNILIGIDGAEVRLYHNGSKKFETTSTGIKVTGVSEFADNTAAIAGGLTTGDVYRTGDLLKIVH